MGARKKFGSIQALSRYSPKARFNDKDDSMFPRAASNSLSLLAFTGKPASLKVRKKEQEAFLKRPLLGRDSGDILHYTVEAASGHHHHHQPPHFPLNAFQIRNSDNPYFTWVSLPRQGGIYASHLHACELSTTGQHIRRCFPHRAPHSAISQ